jgi:transposase InsO family protein
LKKHHVFQSMSRKATCLDNAAMESFFHLLKCETVYLHNYESYDDVALAAADWLDYYNNTRIKQKLGWQESYTVQASYHRAIILIFCPTLWGQIKIRLS